METVGVMLVLVLTYVAGCFHGSDLGIWLSERRRQGAIDEEI